MLVKKREKVYYKYIDKINVELVGDLTETNGVLSGFSKTSYAKLPKVFAPKNDWDWVIKITTGDDVTTNQRIISGVYNKYTGFELEIDASKFKIRLGTGSSSYGIANGLAGLHTVQPNTTYWVRVSFDGAVYLMDYSLDGDSYRNDWSKTSTSIIYGGDFKALGYDLPDAQYPFLGTIDLSESYVNIEGVRWWSGSEIVWKRGTKDDYDFSQEQDLYYAIKFDNSYNQIDYDDNRIKTFIGGGNYSLVVEKEGDYLIEAISGGGSGGYTDGGTDKYSDTSYSYHYYANGGTGAYFKGYVHLTKGEHVINIGTNTIDIGEYGGSITIDDGFEMTGGLNGRCPTPLFKDYTTNTGGALTVSTIVTSTIDYRVGTDRFLQNNGNGYKDNNSKAWDNTPSVAPSNLSQYGYGGGRQNKVMQLGGKAYLKIKYKKGDIV